jgi:hypothetical protein
MSHWSHVSWMTHWNHVNWMSRWSRVNWTNQTTHDCCTSHQMSHSIRVNWMNQMTHWSHVNSMSQMSHDSCKNHRKIRWNHGCLMNRQRNRLTRKTRGVDNVSPLHYSVMR